MKALTDLIFTSDCFYSILRVTTPLLFASMGAVVSDVAGVPNIALEGLMLMAAFAGMFFSGTPFTITCEPTSLVGFNKMGFICTHGSIPAASACITCALPISSPSFVI